MPGKQRSRGASRAQAPVSWDGVTTVMLRNIPSRYTQPTLLEEVYAHGFEGKIDFFYLPMDFTKRTNAGYAFLNFVDEETVQEFRKRFDNERLSGGKLLLVVPAAIQGYTANRDHLAHSAVLNHHKPEHGPLFLREGDGRESRRANQRMPRAFAYSLGEPYLLPEEPASSRALDEVMQRADAYIVACTTHACDPLGDKVWGPLETVGEWSYPSQSDPTLRESRADMDERFLSLGINLDDGEEQACAQWDFARTPERPAWREAQDCSPASDLDTRATPHMHALDQVPDFARRGCAKERGSATPSTCASGFSPQKEDLTPFNLPWLLPPSLLAMANGPGQ